MIKCRNFFIEESKMHKKKDGGFQSGKYLFQSEKHFISKWKIFTNYK